jgi:hypothetical protein
LIALSERLTVTILASGVALGVYVPALLLAMQFQKYTCPTELCVLERYYTPECLQSLLQHKTAFQENFSLALTARKMRHNIWNSLDRTALNLLLRNWQQQQRTKFIVWSGFWLPILEEYATHWATHSLEIDFCRIDAAITPSFKQQSRSFLQGREIWFWQLASGELIYHLPVTDRQTVLWPQRQDRYLLHGGGWGLGNYLSKVSELEQQGFALNVILRDHQEVLNPTSDHRYFRFTPDWLPWEQGDVGQHHFPPLEEWVDNGFQPISGKLHEHQLIPLLENCKAIISKPGGGTLMDAYGTATPLVMLEPYGESEAANALLWAKFGFGILYEDWKQTGFSSTVLTQLHQNLLRERPTINYPQHYAMERLGTAVPPLSPLRMRTRPAK